MVAPRGFARRPTRIVVAAAAACIAIAAAPPVVVAAAVALVTVAAAVATVIARVVGESAGLAERRGLAAVAIPRRLISLTAVATLSPTCRFTKRLHPSLTSRVLGPTAVVATTFRISIHNRSVEFRF
jgi:hypothetical protein